MEVLLDGELVTLLQAVEVLAGQAETLRFAAEDMNVDNTRDELVTYADLAAAARDAVQELVLFSERAAAGRDALMDPDAGQQFVQRIHTRRAAGRARAVRAVTETALRLRSETPLQEPFQQDVVGANIAAAFTDNKEALGEVINVGTGTNHSVNQLTELIGGEREHIPERPGEARETLADITKLKTSLQYEPQVRLEDWIKENE